MTAESLPCPFCEGEVYVGVFDSEGNRRTEEYEDDPWSGLAFGLIHSENDALGECAIATYDGEMLGMYLYDTREEAIAAWNRRAQPANEPLTLEELKQMEGEPTWTVTNGVKGSGRWELIGARDNNCLYLHNVADGFYAIETCTYGKTWLAYRRKPERSEG